MILCYDWSTNKLHYHNDSVISGVCRSDLLLLIINIGYYNILSSISFRYLQGDIYLIIIQPTVANLKTANPLIHNFTS